MKNTQSEIKPIKIGKRPGTMYCLGFKDFIHNFRLQEVRMTNKILREKSNCVVCWSNKPRLLNQNYKNKKQFNVLLTNVIKVRWRFIAWSVKVLKILTQKWLE